MYGRIPLGGHPAFYLLGDFFFKILFIYSTEIRDSQQEREHKQGSGRGRSRLIVEEPDVGLNPITPGSRPELKQTLYR